MKIFDSKVLGLVDKENVMKSKSVVAIVILVSLMTSCQWFKQEQCMVDASQKNYPIFVDKKTENELFEHFVKEKYFYGQMKHQKRYMSMRLANTVLMQRSSRKRLYDHNIFFRGLFGGEINHKKYGNLAKRFVKPVFVDIGSAVIFMEGAPTVRDIYEDKMLNQKFSAIIATDINDRLTPGNAYIDIYNKTKEKYPFPVKEIAMCLDNYEKLDAVTGDYLKGGMALVLRSASSGPDLYYSKKGLENHLKAVLSTYCSRDVLYLFNKFVLYKASSSFSFEIIGVINPFIGIEHRKVRWHEVAWKKRKLRESFFGRKSLVSVK